MDLNTFMQGAALSPGYRLMEACRIIGYRITRTVEQDGETVHYGVRISESAQYLVDQSRSFRRAFNQALANAQEVAPEGIVYNPVCEEVVTCITRACGF
tara:strand:+ start:291 stop:587 length:297 start_codon:yes stop_codon:yes gene_type:complete